MATLLYKTKKGRYYTGDVSDIKNSRLYKNLKGKVSLILTSPPFPLNKKKKYGNKEGSDYKKWLENMAQIFRDLLTDDGSIVIELGNAWEPKKPVQSTLPLESLLAFLKAGDLNLCQQFVCYNPSRLPSPAQWVTVNRIRTIDSYTQVWWMSKSEFPKADNSKVLRPYSDSMEKLLKRKKYNAGKRPSEHNIGKKSFLKNNNGSIMHNVIELEKIDEKRDLRLPKNIFSIANTNSNDRYLQKCRDKGKKPHPARMPLPLASFFIEFLTDKDDIVFDPFAGSNTTGFCAEQSGRRWVAVEIEKEYGNQSKWRFDKTT